MKYKSKGLLLFAYGKEGELYTRKWDMKALTKNLSSNSEKEDFQEMFHTHDIDEKDLIDGKKFLENVRNRIITNDNYISSIYILFNRKVDISRGKNDCIIHKSKR